MSQNIELYHCLACGKVVRQERGLELPHCCGSPMVKAAEDTVPSDDERPPKEERRTVGALERRRRKS